MAAPMIQHGGPHCGQFCTLWPLLELMTAQREGGGSSLEGGFTLSLDHVMGFSAFTLTPWAAKPFPSVGQRPPPPDIS